MPDADDAYTERIQELTDAGRQVEEDRGEPGTAGLEGDAAQTESDPSLSGADAVPDTHERSHHASHDDHGDASRA